MRTNETLAKQLHKHLIFLTESGGQFRGQLMNVNEVIFEATILEEETGGEMTIDTWRVFGFVEYDPDAEDAEAEDEFHRLLDVYKVPRSDEAEPAYVRLRRYLEDLTGEPITTRSRKTL